MLKTNEIYRTKIVGMTVNGDGIGKISINKISIDNEKAFTVFVENALVGDILDVCITELKKSYGICKIVNIIEPSEYRIKPLCPSIKCGGCNLQHCSYDGQLELKQNRVKDSLDRIGKTKDVVVEKTIGMENPYYYRNKSTYFVEMSDNYIKIGFYCRKSHNIASIDGCIIQNKIDADILKVFLKFMELYNIEPYNKSSDTGIVQQIMIRVSDSTGEIMVCVTINGKTLPFKEKLSECLFKINGMKTFLIRKTNRKTSKNSSKINPISTEIVKGNGYITDFIGSIKFQISALSFYQINHLQTKILYDKIVEFCDFSGNETVIDIYCGVGTISLYVARYVKKVIGIEVVKDAISDALKNAELNKIYNAEFHLGKAEEVVPQLLENQLLENQLLEKSENKVDIAIIDPPRKGCDRKLIDTLNKIKVKKIIYVSCDPETLARDLRILTDGEYVLEKVQPIDMFGMSYHVECVALISIKTK